MSLRTESVRKLGTSTEQQDNSCYEFLISEPIHCKVAGSRGTEFRLNLERVNMRCTCHVWVMASNCQWAGWWRVDVACMWKPLLLLLLLLVVMLRWCSDSCNRSISDVLSARRRRQTVSVVKPYKAQIPLRRLPRNFRERRSFGEVGVVEFGLIAALTMLKHGRSTFHGRRLASPCLYSPCPSRSPAYFM